MATAYYNPKQKKVNVDSGTHMSVEMKLFVTTKGKTKKKYIVDEFENKTGRTFDKEDLWYSFDPDSYNFHIVPQKEAKFDDEGKERISDWLKGKLECIKAAAESKTPPEITIGGVSEGTAKEGCTYNHKWICAKSEKNEYLMSFNRLWCDAKDDGTHIHNNFGQAQFMCFPREINRRGKDVGNINRFSDGSSVIFKLMYPRSGDDGEGRFDCESGHLVYNASYDINCDAEKIAQAFVEFIELCEIMENEKTT